MQTTTYQDYKLNPILNALPLNTQTDTEAVVYEVDGTVLRVDAAQTQRGGTPHTEFKSQEIAADWQQGVGTIEFGFGNVVENNLAFQSAAQEFASSLVSAPLHRSLNIEPAWEVDSFRWPSVAKQFLQSHRNLFDQIGNGLLQDLQATRRRIGVCSSQRHEGKTTLATCLARWSATNGFRTLLIDADNANCRLTINSGLNLDLSWRQATLNDAPLSEVMVRSAETGLILMPANAQQIPGIHDKVLLELCEVVFQMKYEFDVVIMDLGIIDGICLHGKQNMDLVDTMLVVRDPSRTSHGQLIETQQVLHNMGISRTAVAENFSQT